MFVAEGGAAGGGGGLNLTGGNGGNGGGRLDHGFQDGADGEVVEFVIDKRGRREAVGNG